MQIDYVKTKKKSLLFPLGALAEVLVLNGQAEVFVGQGVVGGPERIVIGLKLLQLFPVGELLRLFLCTQKLQVEAYAQVGDSFEPELHNPVMHVEDENFGENVISAVFQKGYKIGERVIR